MTNRITMIFAVSCGVCLADVRSGHAEAGWVAASSTYEAGRPLQTAIRLTVDPGWHTYWSNPGEAGMKVSVKWELPQGWQAGELEEPAPKRFMTGKLAGFGYEGVVVYPVMLIPGGEAKENLKIKGKVSWLTCNDAACVQGNADLELSFAPGLEMATPDAGLIAQALGKIPRPNPEIILKVVEKPEALRLILRSATTKPFKPDDCEIFPQPQRVVEPAAKFEFKQAGEEWIAEVPKSEYAPEKIAGLTLVFSPKNGEPPYSVSWKSASPTAGKN